MNRKIVLALAAALVGGTCLWAQHAHRAQAQDNPTSRIARFQAAEGGQQSNDIKQAELNYAKGLLAVAQADLAKMREANSRVPDTIPNTVVRSLEMEVAEAQGRVNAMSGGGKDNSVENPYVALAKQSLEYAEQNLKAAQNANARAAGAVSPAEVQRRQAEVEVARAKLEMANLLNKASAADEMEWQLLQLLADVHDLRQQVRLLQYRN